MKYVPIAVALLVAICTPAWAINKCKGPGGKVIYQDAPCEGAEKVNLSGAGQSDPQSTGTNYWQTQAARLARQEKVEAAIAARQIVIGMTGDEARRSWGNPTKINSSVGSYGKHDQWVYDRGSHRSQYIYVQNGLVTSMQSTE